MEAYTKKDISDKFKDWDLTLIPQEPKTYMRKQPAYVPKGKE